MKISTLFKHILTLKYGWNYVLNSSEVDTELKFYVQEMHREPAHSFCAGLAFKLHSITTILLESFLTKYSTGILAKHVSILGIVKMLYDGQIKRFHLTPISAPNSKLSVKIPQWPISQIDKS